MNSSDVYVARPVFDGFGAGERRLEAGEDASDLSAPRVHRQHASIDPKPSLSR